MLLGRCSGPSQACQRVGAAEQAGVGARAGHPAVAHVLPTLWGMAQLGRRAFTMHPGNLPRANPASECGRKVCSCP